MRRVRLARLRADQAQPVAVNGQPAIAGAAAIAAFLRDNGAPGLDGFLAQPQSSPDGSEIDWYTSHPGTAVPLSALNGHDRLAVEERLAIRLGQLKTLAEAGETPADMKQLLQAAINYPGPDQVYAVGREPVLVMWGHRGAPAAAAVPPIAAPSAAATASAGSAAAAETVAARSPWRRWLLLGLLALLLLAALLTLGYCWRRDATEPPPAPVAEPQAPQIDPDLVKELEQERDRADDLRKQLAALQQQFDDKLKQCPVEQPAPQPEPQVTPPEPPKVEEPKPEPPKADVKPEPKPEPKPVVPPKKTEKPPKKEPPKEQPPKQQAAVQPPAPAEPSKAQCQKLVPQRKKWEAPEVVFVVDASGSMEDRVGGETRLDAAKDSVSFIADHLPGDVDTALVKFTDCNAVDNDYFLNRSQLKQKVNQLQPSGGTPLARSIERAARIISPTKETVIVVVTDGDDTCRQKDPCQVAAAAKASHPNLTINVVDVSGQGLGSCIARNGGGRVLPANTPLEIQKAIKDATNQVMLPTSCVEGN
jgi:Mg-chelatase subunit ChlD